MYEIVILGGGFAGIAATRSLKNLQKKIPMHITLIDRHPYHLFTPSLYEVATSEEPQKNVAIPFTEIFDDVTILKQEILSIDQEKKIIHFSDGTNKEFDYGVIALGSEAVFFNIPGLHEYSIPLKTVANAITIKNFIKKHYCQQGKTHQKIHIIIGGGGFSGTELAAELISYRNHLAKKHQLILDCMDIGIIQGSDRILKELDQTVSNIAKKRLERGGITLYLGSHIIRVTDTHIETDDKKIYPYDLLIWTGGIQAPSMLKTSNLPLSPHGQIQVGETLQVINSSFLFAAGDNIFFIDKKTNKQIPTVAQVAEEQGAIAGENIIRLIMKKPLRQYYYKHFGYIVPLRGHFSVAELGSFHLIGFLAWILQQLVFFQYLLRILPVMKALKRWNQFEMRLEQTL